MSQDVTRCCKMLRSQLAASKEAQPPNIASFSTTHQQATKTYYPFHNTDRVTNLSPQDWVVGQAS